MDDKFKFIEEEAGEAPKYEDSPFLEGVISKEDFDFLNIMNKGTAKNFLDEWENNIINNFKSWKKHKAIRTATGLCKNKAIIGIGAGQSFNKNKDTLKWFLDRDGVKNWNDRNFVTIASNHQLKPLLEMGIIPDFVLLVDASDVVMDQLTKDIPKSANGVTLITGVHCSPRVIEEWTRQKRSILFYGPTLKELMKTFQDYYKVNPHYHRVELGGNVLNGAWVIGSGVMGSTAFYAVGNDLSFPKAPTVDEKRSKYYSDGDYTTNAEGTGTGRDEANTEKEWAGFTLSKSNILNMSGHGRYNIELDIVCTSMTLWVYKIWLEMQIMRHTEKSTRFTYWNCSEAGILGVMAKEYNEKALRDKNNWFLLDETAVNKHTGSTMYHTAMLKDGLDFFIQAKEAMKCHKSGVLDAGGSGGLVTTATVLPVLQ
jgi:hypothetical protein